MRFNEQLIDLPTLHHVIDRCPLTISRDSYVADAMNLMSQERSNRLPLSSYSSLLDSSRQNHPDTSYVLVMQERHLLAILTQQDIVRLIAFGTDLSQVKISEVMRKPVITLKPSDSPDIFTVLSLLRRHQIRHLPIVDDGGQFLGIVTQKSLLQGFDLVSMARIIEALEQPQDELRQFNQPIEIVRSGTRHQMKQSIEEQPAGLVQVNEELQQTIEELQIVEEELRQQNEELANAREIAELERQRYQDLFDFAPDGYLVTDVHCVIQEANDAAAKLLAVRQKYLAGKPFILFIAEPERYTFINQLKNSQHIQDWEIYLQPREGTPFPASIRLAPINDSQNRLIGWRWLVNNISHHKQVEEELRQATEELEIRVVERTAELLVTNQQLQQEITERQRAEEALRRSEKLYRQLVENQRDLITRIDLQGRFTFANKAACEALGRRLDELIGESSFQFSHPDELPQVMENIKALTLPPYHLTTGEERLFTANGIRWYQWNIAAIKDETGEIIEIQALGRDVTERKQIENALRQSEEKFRHFADNTHALIWVAKPESGENLYVNPAYEKIWRRSCQSLRDHPNSWIDSIHPEDCDRVTAKLEQQMRGESVDTEYRILQPDGSIRWIWDRGFAMRDQQGNVYSYGGVADDITERKQAEESLRESETRLSLALSSAHMGIWDWNIQTNDTLWSDNMGPLYGLPSGTLCPSIEDFLQLIHPEDREDFSNAVKCSIGEGREFFREYRTVWPDGNTYWLSIRGQVYYNKTDQPIRMIGTTRDITERKQAEEALRESEERYRSVVTAMSEGVALYEADGSIIACNASVESILGLTRDEIIGRSCNDACRHIIHEDGSPFPGETHPAMVTLRTGQPCSNVVMGIHKPNGQLTWISINSQPLLRDNDPNPYAVVVSFTDISARKQAEQKIHEQAALLDIATDAIFVRDLQNQILFWNQGAERIYGWQAQEAMGKNSKELLYKATLSQFDEEAFKTVIESGSWQGELKKVQKSGAEIIVQSRWTLRRDAEGQPISILTVDTDITQKKQLEEQFLRTQRLESLGTLASGISHDFNNILTPILAAAQLLQARFSPDKEHNQQLLQIIENNARRGADLVKQVLSFARGVRGERTIVQLKHLIAEIGMVAKQTFPKSIKFTAAIPEELWAISGDATQLHQVLMNLAVNAHDAMPEGGVITISAKNMVIDEAYTRMNLQAKVGHYVVMTITDTGSGMSPEILDKIFEPFFTTKEMCGGTGLGLSTALGIIKSHGGFVNVSSQIGKGSQFKLFLPAVQATQSMTTDDMGMLAGNGELILVVDDEAPIREIAKLILETHNYKTLTASNGIEAIALYAQNKRHISAVFMDMMMPEMDGTTAIRTLQKMNPSVQIIAWSGLTSSEALAQAARTGVQLVLPKPFTAKELLHNLDCVLRQRN